MISPITLDEFLVVIEPGARSVQTYQNIKKLAGDLGIKRVRVVANKVSDERDERFIRDNIPENELLGIIHYSRNVAAADRDASSPFDSAPETVEEIRQIKKIIDRVEV